MKKKYLIIAIVVLIIILLIRYFTCDYEKEYEVLGYHVKEVCKDSTITFTISNEDYVYKYILFVDRGLSRKSVDFINSEQIDDYICINPTINGKDTYYLCSNKEEIITKEALEGIIEEVIDSDFIFNKLDDEEYMLIWKYDGFYYLNGINDKSINLLSFDRYSNDLMYQIDKYIVFPKYSSDYEFSTFIVLDITTGKYKEINTNYKINYDSYYAGNYKNSLFLFDNKNEVLYEIKYRSNKVKIVGSEALGYFKIEKGKEVKATLKEYIKDKITYFNSSEEVLKVVDNCINFDNYSFIYTSLGGKVIKVIDDSVYYIYDDNIFKYSNGKTEFVCHYFELNFNNRNNIYVYKK